MSWFTGTGQCIDGGHGWGVTGQIQSIGNVEASTIQEARKLMPTIFPGGWRITKIVKQTHCHDGQCKRGCA